MYQLPLWPWEPPERKPPVPARIILPERGPPLSEAELEALRTKQRAALAAYQARLAAFDELEPPLPVMWSNWREASAREKRQKAFVRESLEALHAAMDRHREGICASV